MIEFNKTYTYDFTGKVMFGDLPENYMYEILKDGRITSHFLERFLEVEFPQLVFVDARGHDFVDGEGCMYDQKTFTKGGMRFMPSSMIGTSRRFDESVAHAHASNVNYICCDIVEFPIVHVVFKTGASLLEDYPRCTIPLKDRFELFNMAA